MSFRLCLIFQIVVLLFSACTHEPPPAADVKPQKDIATPTEIYVASGAGYRKPVDELKDLFESQTHITVNCIYGNMRQITTQAQSGGKISVVIGDVKFLKKTTIHFKKEILIGKGKLVIAVDRTQPFGAVDELANPQLGRIIVPDSQKAIYGRAAYETLKNLNIFDEVQSRLITVQTVPQVTSYLASGTAQIGFMNRTDFLSLDQKRFDSVDIDQSLYTPIFIAAALTPQSTEAAEQYMQFIQSEVARKVFNKYGLGLD